MPGTELASSSVAKTSNPIRPVLPGRLIEAGPKPSALSPLSPPASDSAPEETLSEEPPRDPAATQPD
ncbi:hypothetical protein EYF80_068232 [Liparis tanakae]|uniref:Uncharacterized protein n=1 Tax=Liparis tanakae TaxID=230148 RepID=A0A4Z2DYR2_9TELE|nr:hypothetical protein EYF80_068232 [Liparis tanakae]